MYEGIYARAGSDLSAIPWASLHAHPALVGWLESRPAAAAGAALVVGCGLGDDAEYLSSEGFSTVAFDFSPTAIDRCRERFPASVVDYRVADLFAMPETWLGGFDLVVEIRTLQSMPPGRRHTAVAAVAAAVNSGGLLFTHGFLADAERFDGPPWPVTAQELAGFTAAGLRRVRYGEDSEVFAGDGMPVPVRSFTAVYQQPGRG